MREYVDFLGGQPPYDELDSTDLDALARLVEVEFFPAGTRIIEAGESPLSHFYVVRTGEVEVIDRGRVIDLLGSGETFGQISVLSGLPPPLDVRAAEDSLCYRFPDPSSLTPNVCNFSTTTRSSPANASPGPAWWIRHCAPPAIRCARPSGAPPGPPCPRPRR
ncbi:cyclic nucleotide-binding domain-containing protein [Rhodococcus koreensis]